MAITTVKSTYALDVGTVATLEEIARRWGVSKSEALRRAIRAAAGSVSPSERDALKAFRTLQGSLRLSPGKARAWINRIRIERASGSRLQGSRR